MNLTNSQCPPNVPGNVHRRFEIAVIQRFQQSLIGFEVRSHKERSSWSPMCFCPWGEGRSDQLAFLPAMSLLNGEVGKTFDLTTLHSYFQKQTITRPEIHTIHLHQCRKVPYTQVQPASTTEIRSVKENLYVWVIEWSNVEYTPCLIGNIKTRYGDPYKPHTKWQGFSRCSIVWKYHDKNIRCVLEIGRLW